MALSRFLLLIVLIGLPAATLADVPDLDALPSLQTTSRAVEGQSLPSKGVPSGILFDSIQFHVGGADSVTSQNHTDLPLPDGSGRDLESFSADDFEVDGFGWIIDQVEVKGHYFNVAGGATAVNVYFLGDANGLPGLNGSSGGSDRGLRRPFIHGWSSGRR